MFEHLEVELLLGVVGLHVDQVPKVCSGHWLRLEETYSTGKAGLPESLHRGGRSYSWCRGRCCGPFTCDPGCVRAPGIQASSACFGTACRIGAHGLLALLGFAKSDFSRNIE